MGGLVKVYKEGLGNIRAIAQMDMQGTTVKVRRIEINPAGKKNACDDKATPCLNGGICVSLDDKNFVCNCPKEYEGKYCESKRSMGVGSIGTPLSPLLLITLWALWMALVVIFIWCSVSALLAWWSRRIRRLLNPAAA